MKKYINEAVRMQQLAGIRPLNEEKEPIKSFFFGYDLDAIQAVSDYIRSKYKVVGQHEWDGGEGVDAVEWVEMGDDTMATLDVHNPAMLQDREFLGLVAAAEEGEDDRDEITFPLMEEDQDVKAKVDKAITSNFQELSKALKDRKANKEDIDAHDAVKAAVIKIAKEVGIKDAEDTPWMEEEMFSGALSPKEAIQSFREMLQDTLEDTIEEDQAVTDYPDTDEKGVETAIPGDKSSAVLDEYEVIYMRGNDGKCYRVDDEGNRDQVADHYCRR